MLNVLLESRAPRTRRMGSTVASAVLHAALIAGAVALTMPAPVDAKGRDEPDRPPIKYVDIRSQPPAPPVPQDRGQAPATPQAPTQVTVTAPDVVPDALPPVDVGPTIPPDEIVIGGPAARVASSIGSGAPMLSAGGTSSAIDEQFVDRAPRLLGRALEPRYPAGLRDAGVQGRVVVQFVVDTLGRAELGELLVLETPHAAFVESVRAALARYRFSVGEAGGRKVRTRVQLPFEFTLTR